MGNSDVMGSSDVWYVTANQHVQHVFPNHERWCKEKMLSAEQHPRVGPFKTLRSFQVLQVFLAEGTRHFVW